MMIYMASRENAELYAGEKTDAPPEPLIENHPMKILMVPFEYHGKIGPIVESLQNIKVPLS